MNNSLYYRITYEGEGIYNVLKKKVTKEEWLNLLSSEKINWLPKPPSYDFNNKSFFTQKGYDKFNDFVLPLICNYLEKEKIKIEKISSLNDIIYEDEYQVVIKE